MHKIESKYHLRYNKKTSRFSFWILFLFLFVAVFGDFIANERPIYAQYEGKQYFPIFHQYLETLGASPYNFIQEQSWHEVSFDSKLMPLIPYAPYNITTGESSLVSPWTRSMADEKWHWLGTDAIGRDVASGIVHGTRLALIVGILASFITMVLGMLIGIFTAYFGDDRFKISRWSIAYIFVFNFFAVFYLFHSMSMMRCVWLLIWILGNLVLLTLQNFSLFSKKMPSRLITIPMDLVINRFIEIFKALPNLLILMTLIAVFEISSIYGIALILGALSWPNIARIVRAEALNIRDKEYIVTAQMLGLSHTKIMLQQILPNIVAPVIVAFIFGVSGAIIAEATLSFLGIGVRPEDVTWGSLLSAARNNMHAWWLAIFPGLCIFLLVSALNDWGEHYLKSQRD